MAKMQNKKYIDSNIDKTNSLFEVKPSFKVVSTKYPEFLLLAPSPANCASTKIIFLFLAICPNFLAADNPVKPAPIIK